MRSLSEINFASSSNYKITKYKITHAPPLSFRRASALRNLLFGCATLLCIHAAAQNTTYKQDPTWHAPDQASARKNPLVENKNAAAGGAKLFHRHCAECHGPTGTGLKKAANLTMDAVQSQTAGTLFWKITNGNPDRGMPSFSQIPELQRWQLVLHLRALRPTQ